METKEGQASDIKALDRCSQNYTLAIEQLQFLAFIKLCDAPSGPQNEIGQARYLFNGSLSRQELSDVLNLIQDLGSAQMVAIRPLPQFLHNLAIFILLPEGSQIRRLSIDEPRTKKKVRLFTGSVFVQNGIETLFIHSN